MTLTMKQTIDDDSNEVHRSVSATLRKRTSKAPGTRVGILQDWRGFSNGNGPGRHGKAVRDGR